MSAFPGRVAEERHQADAGVQGVGGELDAAALELGPGGHDVLDVEGDRVRVHGERHPHRLRADDAQGEAAGLEFGAVAAAVASCLRQAEHLAVEMHGCREVGRGDRNEVDAGDGGRSCGHDSLLDRDWRRA